MYHIKLIKARSYTGVVFATQKNPDVFVEDKATAAAAVATGYFELVEEIITGHLDRDQLEKMKKDDLKKLAADMGIDASGFKKNSDYVDAIIAVNVTTDENSSEEEASEETSEADFGEEE